MRSLLVSVDVSRCAEDIKRNFILAQYRSTAVDLWNGFRLVKLFDKPNNNLLKKKGLFHFFGYYFSNCSVIEEWNILSPMALKFTSDWANLYTK